jgi:hypothetical protein
MFPLIAVIVAITGILSKSIAIQRTAFMLFTIGAITTVLAMSTGEGAEDMVEKIRGFSKDYIETHEESAETFALLSYILGGISVVGLGVSFRRPTASAPFSYLLLAFSGLVLFYGQHTATSGGEIRHKEIRQTEIRAKQETAATESSDQTSSDRSS